VIDSQSTKTTEAGGPRGYDAGKNVRGGEKVGHWSGGMMLLRAE
jgi:hypothetical protein